MPNEATLKGQRVSEPIAPEPPESQQAPGGVVPLRTQLRMERSMR